MEVICYGEPLTLEDESEHPLYYDYEWISSKDCLLKGDSELKKWANYLENNSGEIYPMSVLTEEHHPVNQPRSLEHIRNHKTVNLLSL